VSRFRATGPADAGSSLAELLVSMVVFGIVGAIVTVTVTMTLRTSRATTDRVDNLSGAQVALDAMSKMIQTAAQPPAVNGVAPSAAVFKATGTDFAFYGYDTPGAPPAKIEFVVVNGNLRETVTPSTNSGPLACQPPYAYGTGVTRTLASGVSTSSPVFSYFSQPTATNLTGMALSLVGTPASLSTSDMAAVELVGVTVLVGQNTNPSVAPTGATITVSLPNHLVATTSLPKSAC
jgi:type II secretory pathway pseudopilin PulG